MPLLETVCFISVCLWRVKVTHLRAEFIEKSGNGPVSRARGFFFLIWIYLTGSRTGSAHGWKGSIFGKLSCELTSEKITCDFVVNLWKLPKE